MFRIISIPTPVFVIALFIFLFSCESSKYDPPKTPEETIASFTLPPGFVAEVFAAEPFVADPVEMIFDQKGRCYVVEMPDYPFKPEAGKGMGKIKQLFDDNNDGRIDRSVIFADHISEATSVHPWKDGLLVAAAPNISWLKDTNGDGKADSTEILFSGFFENNSEAQITNLKFMPDNWIYASNNGQAGEITYHRAPDRGKISVAGADFRFRLDRDEYELVSGPAQFGQSFNDRIHKFVTQNTLHMRQPVIPWKYLHRNPSLPSKNATVNVSDHDLEMFQLTPPPYWRAERTRRRQKAYDEQGNGRIEYAEDHFTGASGATFYGGNSFPDEYYGSIFIGDVSGNLVHRDLLIPQEGSPTYTASRAEKEKQKEFLASTDSWFRPANFNVGPDGNLYIIDMYRQHIETPLSIPEDLKEDMDFMAGSDRGRIYRIRPADQSAVSQFEDVSTKSAAELVQLLEHPNRWHRLHAQQLLVEKNDPSVKADLQQMFESSDNELARLSALYTLEALHQLDVAMVKQALKDSSPTIREQAILLAEQMSDGQTMITDLANDPDVRVRFQAILSLGNYTGAEIEKVLMAALADYPDDPWYQLAVLSAPSGSSYSFLEKILNDGSGITIDSSNLDFLQDLAYAIGNRQQQDELEKMEVFLVNDQQPSALIFQPILEGFLMGHTKADKKVELPKALINKIENLKKEDPEKWKGLEL